MIFNHRYFNVCTFVLVAVFVSSCTATFCGNLTSTKDKETPCFLEPPTHNPARLRSSSHSLVLPCHVARSKRSTIEWWYEDFQRSITIKIYPVFPAVRPTVLRFITSISPISKASNETDIIDVSVLLRHVNVDDSGIYRCVIRPWTANRMNNIDENSYEYNADLPTLSYHVELTGPRLCQISMGSLPCFSSMRTSSPTVIDAYQTAFLQCVVQNHHRPINVFWVVGNASANSVLITDHLATNQNNGDRLRRVFPLSPYDYSLELSINRDTRERTYSCVVAGATDIETTLFTYIVRSINVDEIAVQTPKAHKHEATETTTISHESKKDKSSTASSKIVAHDILTPEQVEDLRQKTQHNKNSEEDLNNDDDLSELSRLEETSTTI